MRLCALLLVVTLLAILVDPLGADAQTTRVDAFSGNSEAGDETQALDSPEAVRAMVARLSDAEVRALLLERLDAQAATDGAEETDIVALGRGLGAAAEGLTTSIGNAFERAPNLVAGWGEALGKFWGQRGWGGTAFFLAVLAGAVALGVAAMRGVRAVLHACANPVLQTDARLGTRARALGLRFLAQAAEAAAFLGVFWAVIELVLRPSPPEPRPSDYLVLWFLLKEPLLYVFAMHAVARFLFAPERPDLRLVNMDDEAAGFLTRNLVIFAAIAGARIYLLNFLGGHGVDLASLRFGFWMNILMYGWLAYVVWHVRHAMTHSLIGEIVTPTPGERRIAEAYPYISLAAIGLFWLLTETFIGLGRFDLLDGRLPLTLLILMFAPAADRVIRALVYGVSPPEEGEGEAAEAAFLETRRGYIRIGRVVLAFIVIEALVDLWNVDASTMQSAGIGARIGVEVLQALAIVGIGYLLAEIVSIRINSLLAREKGPETMEDEAGGEGGGAGGSRLATVLPLVSVALQVAIWSITVLTALSTLGVDTTPLLAGAGIVGLAVGFGAQTLVADIVSGIFFLIDDAFRTGEYVEVEGTFGTVEAISIRSLRLRHHEGPVHTIPFGQIPKLTNYSRDWVIMKLRFTVPFDTDLRKVKRLFKQIGKDMMEIPEFAVDFLQPFKSQGVLEVDDVGMVIRGKFMAKPGRQWVLRKEIYQRVQQAFDENGIQFARKEVRVKIDGDAGGLSDEQRHQVAAAASEAAVNPTGKAD